MGVRWCTDMMGTLHRYKFASVHPTHTYCTNFFIVGYQVSSQYSILLRKVLESRYKYSILQSTAGRACKDQPTFNENALTFTKSIFQKPMCFFMTMIEFRYNEIHPERRNQFLIGASFERLKDL